MPPAMVVGCMAIHLCTLPETVNMFQVLCMRLTGVTGGDRFTDPHEQDHLIQVLIQTDKLHGWPTHVLQRQLRETWGIR